MSSQLSRMMAAQLFRTSEFQEHGGHIGLVGLSEFKRTPVIDLIEDHTRKALTPEAQKRRVIWGTFGDPTKFKGFGAYPGYRRFKQRCLRFKASKETYGYQPDGNPALKARTKAGWTKKPGYKEIPEESIGGYITPGVAGAIRHMLAALILPKKALPSMERLRDIHEQINRWAERRVPPTPEEAVAIGRILDSMQKSATPDNIVMPEKSYSHAAEVCLAHGDVKTCSLTPEGQVDVGDLKAQIDENTKGVLLVTVGNPTCTAMEPDIFNEVLEIIQEKMKQFKRPIALIADTIYEQLRRKKENRIDPIQMALAGGFDVPVFDMRSFSKMLAIPGERIGFHRELWHPHVFPDWRHDVFKALELIDSLGLCYVGNEQQSALADLYSSINAGDPVEEQLAPLAGMLTALKQLTESKGNGLRTTVFTVEETMERLKEMGVEEDFFSTSFIATETRKISNKQLQGYSVDIDKAVAETLATQAEKGGLVDIVEKEGVKYLKLKAEIPPVKRDPKTGQLILFGISKEGPWRKIAERCELATEDREYEKHSEYMREESHRRTMYFVERAMKVPGVYFNPVIYSDPDRREVDEDRINNWYIEWGFEKYREFNPDVFQATVIARMCLMEEGLPIIAQVPVELFHPPELRPLRDTYNRHVALLPPDEADEMIRIMWRLSSLAR